MGLTQVRNSAFDELTEVSASGVSSLYPPRVTAIHLRIVCRNGCPELRRACPTGGLSPQEDETNGGAKIRLNIGMIAKKLKTIIG